MNDTITVSAGVLSINGQPQIRFPSTAWAFVFLARLGYKVIPNESAEYAFAK